MSLLWDQVSVEAWDAGASSLRIKTHALRGFFVGGCLLHCLNCCVKRLFILLLEGLARFRAFLRLDKFFGFGVGLVIGGVAFRL